MKNPKTLGITVGTLVTILMFLSLVYIQKRHDFCWHMATTTNYHPTVGEINIDDLQECKKLMGDDFSTLTRHVVSVAPSSIVTGNEPFYVIYNGGIFHSAPWVVHVLPLPFGLSTVTYYSPDGSLFTGANDVQLMSCHFTAFVEQPNVLYVVPCDN